jgi:pimeloyl-ACP methyl ester carboxylesterase
MERSEVRALGRLGVEAYAGVIAHIEKVHAKVADLSFRLVPTSGAPAHAAHDAIAAGTYRAVRGVGSVAGNAVAEILPLATLGLGNEPMGASGGPNHVQAALNAALGDRLSDEGNPLAIRMALRSGGRDIRIDQVTLAEAVQHPSPRIALFVHGLGETDDSWRFHAGPAEGTYAEHLAAEFGYTCQFVRYNTGRHVSQNGRELATLLSELVNAWPVPVERLLLVGHSMGGLVVRSACHYGEELGAPWTPLVRNVVLLASPNLGAPLARWTHTAARLLAKRKDEIPFSPVVTTRSAGIDDLRFGYLIDEDWEGCNAESCKEDHRHDVALLAGATYVTVSATLTQDPASPLGQLVGDLLVQPASAHGGPRQRQHIPFTLEGREEFGGRHHFSLLNDPDVWEALRSRIALEADSEPPGSAADALG